MYPCPASDFMEKETSLACLFGSGLNYIFHWNAHSLIIDKSLLMIFWDEFLSKTLEKKDDHEP